MQHIRSILTLMALIIGSQFKAECQTTVVKGKVHKWITDTVYVSHIPFYSPHSSKIEYQVISKDSTFHFSWENIDEPFIISITYLKSFSDEIIENLLFENLTEEYYYGQCIKFFQNGSTMYLIEPHTTLNLDLTANTWLDTLTEKQATYYKNLGVTILEGNTARDYGKTGIRFIGDSDNFNNNYYQDFFNRRNMIDNTLESYSSQNVNMAIINTEKIMQSLIANLKNNKSKLSPTFYNYLTTEVEFGAKMQLLKKLTLKKTNYLKEVIRNENIPESLLRMVAFDKYSISNTDLRSEMYNEYLEFYINFVMNLVDSTYLEYHPFDKKKLGVVLDELPDKSLYYYVANHLLEVEDSNVYQDIYDWILVKFPDEVLNDKLIEKFE